MYMNLNSTIGQTRNYHPNLFNTGGLGGIYDDGYSPFARGLGFGMSSTFGGLMDLPDI